MEGLFSGLINNGVESGMCFGILPNRRGEEREILGCKGTLIILVVLWKQHEL